MYSLYRAWLSLGPCSIPALPSPPPPPPPPQPPLLNLSAGAPDVALQVGPALTHFSAHRAVLSAHSGFFKAALLNQTEPTPIGVPNVNVDEFSSLLTFMYTGYLDLNLSNIYNILLATHILHMPRALEICRSFLLQTQPSPAIETMETTTTTTRSSIIKPIASRKTALPIQQFYAPTLTITNRLKKSEATPFKTVASTSTTTQATVAPPLIEKPNQASTSSSTIDNDIVTMTTDNNQSDEISVGDERSTTTISKKCDKTKKKRTTSTLTNLNTINSNNNNNSDDRVIIDIACCDGPVRFHRVVNKNYGRQEQSENFVQVHEVNRNAAMNKAMTENIRQMSDENISTHEMFTCLYCNHTFKSQYCYQKHARRHINPVSVQVAKQQQQKEAVVAVGGAAVASAASATSRREVKLLDMNVQYYPCKTCGSKFPSYYFVHKHRKMCHADEMIASDGNVNTAAPTTAIIGGNQPQDGANDEQADKEKTASSSSDGGASIDVEIINNDV